jgi:hypothetical protein
MGRILGVALRYVKYIIASRMGARERPHVLLDISALPELTGFDDLDSPKLRQDQEILVDRNQQLALDIRRTFISRSVTCQ